MKRIAKPLADRVILREDPVKDKKTASGIILLGNYRENELFRSGEVLAVGPGYPDTGDQMILKPGDRVQYPSHAGSEFEHNGETLKIMREGEIHARL